MTGKEFEQIIRISFERKKFTNLIIDKKLFRNFAHVYCKSAVRPGMFHYNLKEKTEVVKPFLDFYFGLSFLGNVQQPRSLYRSQNQSTALPRLTKFHQLLCTS